MSETAKPCPFCGGNNIKTYRAKFSSSGKTMSKYFVTFCLDCESEGPKAISQNTAILLWNRRGENGLDKA